MEAKERFPQASSEKAKWVFGLIAILRKRSILISYCYYKEGI